MNDLNALTPPLPPSQPLPEAAQTRTEGQAPVSGTHLLGIAEMLPQTRLVSQSRSTDNGDVAGATSITNANGAPSIGGVLIDFSPESLSVVVMAMRGKMLDGQGRADAEDLRATQLQIDQKHAQALDNIKKWQKKCESAAHKSLLGKIFGWVTKVAAFVGSAVATGVLALGAPEDGPLLALSVIALVGSTVSLASAISQEAGGPALDISSLMVKACSAVLKGFGVPQDELDAASHTMAGAIGLVSGTWMVDPQLLGDLASGAAELNNDNPTTVAILGASFTALGTVAMAATTFWAAAGGGAVKSATTIAEDIATIASDATKNLPRVAKIVQGSVQTVSALGTVTTGGLNVAVAYDEHDADMAQVAQDDARAWVTRLQAQFEDDTADLQNVLKASQQNIEQTSQMIADAGRTFAQAARNSVTAQG